jgi:hypothetical protein
MAITTISHTVCLDCSENEFVVTGSLDGGSIAGKTNSLSVTEVEIPLFTTMQR